MIMILLANVTRHAEGVRKAARLGHAANCIFAGAPARVMLPLAVLVRILGEAYCYTTVYYIRACLTTRPESSSDAPIHVGNPYAMRVLNRLALKPLEATVGGNKRHKSLTGKHSVIVSAANPRVNHIAGV